MDALTENVMMFVSAAEFLSQFPGHFLAADEKDHELFSKGLMECAAAMLGCLADEREIDQGANLGDLGLNRAHDALRQETISRVMFAPVYYSTKITVAQRGISSDSQAVFSGIANHVVNQYTQYTWIEDVESLVKQTNEAYPDLAKLVVDSRPSSSGNNAMYGGSASKSSRSSRSISSINSNAVSYRDASKKAPAKTSTVKQRTPDAREQAYMDAIGEMKTTAETPADFTRLANVFRGFGEYKNSRQYMDECYSKARKIREQQEQMAQGESKAPMSWRDIAEKVAIAIAFFLFFAVPWGAFALANYYA